MTNTTHVLSICLVATASALEAMLASGRWVLNPGCLLWYSTAEHIVELDCIKIHDFILWQVRRTISIGVIEDDWTPECYKYSWCYHIYVAMLSTWIKKITALPYSRRYTTFCAIHSINRHCEHELQSNTLQTANRDWWIYIYKSHNGI